MANDPQTYALGYEGPEVQEILEKSEDLGPATQSKDGLMSAADKEKLDGVSTGAQANVIEQIEVGGVILVPAEKKVVIPVDAAAAQGGANPVSSGALYAALLNYYTSAEVDQLIAGIKQFTYEVVAELPTASADTMYCIYFVPSTNPGTQNVKDEYITVRSGEEGSYTYSWELIGTTAVDISGKADKVSGAVAGNLAGLDASGNLVDSGVPVEKIGEIEEEVSVLRNSAGIAEGIADTISAGTPQEFVFRQSGGDGVNYMKRIKGRCIVWNQLVKNGNFADGATNWSGNFTVSDGVATITAQGQYGGIAQPVSLISGHKYYISCQFKPTTAASYIRFGIGHSNRFGTEGVATSLDAITDTSKFTYVSYVGTWTSDDNTQTQIIMMDFRLENRDSFYIKDVHLIDLTLLGLGDITAEQFEALYPEAYYPYNAGSVEPNDASEIETVGRNLWDGTYVQNSYINPSGDIIPTPNYDRTDYIPIFGGAQYYFKSFSVASFYDAEKHFISQTSYLPGNITTAPNNARYVICYTSFQVHITDIKNHWVNLSDASFNGQYEPYWKRRIELNIPELKDKDGNLVFPYGGMHGVGTAFDSMKPEADGFIHYANRVFKRVNLGDLTWRGTPGSFRADLPDAKNISSSISVANMICSKYIASEWLNSPDKSISMYTIEIMVNDSDYISATAEQFKAAMDGVYLYYEVATPAVVELAEPIPNAILVDSYGTEQAIFPEHEDGSPSAPFACDSNYSISVKNLVAFINAQNNG